MTATISPRLVTALDAAWQAIRERHPDVPEVVITMASGAGKYGHFADARWQRGDDRLPEMFVAGEGLARGARDVLGTLLHEAAHGIAHTRRERAGDDENERKRWKETTRQGRYHNKRFAEIAREVGIDVAYDRRIGWSATTVPDATAAAYRGPLRRLDAALVAWRHPEAGRMRGGRTSSNNPLAARCGCPRRIRVAESVLALGPITCGLCGEDFTADEDGS